jgi:hypothetical protein
LLWVARRTRELPEIAIGLSFLLAGALGFLLEVVGQAPAAALPPAAVGPLTAAGKLSIDLGIAAQLVFTWRVFRPNRAWACAFAVWSGCLLAASFLGQAMDGFSGRQLCGFWFWADFAGRAAAPAWNSFESLRYYTMMRRRVKLGLADPVSAHRFLLWGLGSGAGFGMFLTGLVTRYLGSGGAFTNASVLVMSSLGLFAAVAYWLTFFPPAAYRGLVAGATDAGDSARTEA